MDGTKYGLYLHINRALHGSSSDKVADSLKLLKFVKNSPDNNSKEEHHT
jgi:hypothetical protein